ncbi:hypothetical protein Tco_0368452 [Tanacetum coccineum]
MSISASDCYPSTQIASSSKPSYTGHTESSTINSEATTITPQPPENHSIHRLPSEKNLDALLKVLERHTADLIEKYSVLPGPESVKNQESEKSPKEIIRAKKEQDEEKQDSTYSIRSTDKVDLEEFDLKMTTLQS